MKLQSLRPELRNARLEQPTALPAVRILRIAIPRPDPHPLRRLEVVRYSEVHEVLVLRRRHDPIPRIWIVRITLTQVPLRLLERPRYAQVVPLLTKPLRASR